MLRGLSAQKIIKGPVCPRNVMFWSLIIITISLAAMQTRTRGIGGYDSTREGAWGTKCYSYFLITLLSKGGNRLRELLEEGQEVLIFPTRLLKLASSLMGGLEWWLGHWFPIHSLILHSHTPMHALPCTPWPIHWPILTCVLVGKDKGNYPWDSW